MKCLLAGLFYKEQSGSKTQNHVVGVTSKNYGFEDGFGSLGRSVFFDVKLGWNQKTGRKDELAISKFR